MYQYLLAPDNSVKTETLEGTTYQVLGCNSHPKCTKACKPTCNGSKVSGRSCLPLAYIAAARVRDPNVGTAKRHSLPESTDREVA